MFITLPSNCESRTIVKNHDGSPASADGAEQETMYENFTDAENTGAPLVPMIEEPTDAVTDGSEVTPTPYEEAILSHRLDE